MSEFPSSFNLLQSCQFAKSAKLSSWTFLKPLMLLTTKCCSFRQNAHASKLVGVVPPKALF